MARPRSAGFDDQRDQILVAAATLFAARGFPAATMQDVAAASGVSKATLYHYVRDKQGLLLRITAGHVARLEALVASVQQQQLAPEPHLRALIAVFMRAYADAQAEHRVLTEDVRFLPDADRHAVLGAQRRVVAAFADAVQAVRAAHASRSGDRFDRLRGTGNIDTDSNIDIDIDSDSTCDTHRDSLHTPLAMLLFGMLNWTFTWLKPGGTLTHDTLAPIVADLFLGGLPALRGPAGVAP